MEKRTAQEIEAIKNAVKPFTPGERAAAMARRDAIWSGEAVAEAIKGSEEPTAGIPQDALDAEARQRGIPVSDLTSDQLKEVRASLPQAEGPTPRARGGRQRAEPKPEPEARPEG